MRILSLGLVETLGYVAAIEAADVGSKAASVRLLGYERGLAGLITVKFAGDVAAVRAAVTAGAAAAEKIGKVVAVHVIARPDRQLHVISGDSAIPQEPQAEITEAEILPEVPVPVKANEEAVVVSTQNLLQEANQEVSPASASAAKSRRREKVHKGKGKKKS